MKSASSPGFRFSMAVTYISYVFICARHSHTDFTTYYCSLLEQEGELSCVHARRLCCIQYSYHVGLVLLSATKVRLRGWIGWCMQSCMQSCTPATMNIPCVLGTGARIVIWHPPISGPHAKGAPCYLRILGACCWVNPWGWGQRVEIDLYLLGKTNSFH